MTNFNIFSEKIKHILAVEVVMKKIIFTLAIFFVVLGISGCSSKMTNLDLVVNNMSEETEVYYCSDSGETPFSISSGFREEPFKYDGSNQKKVVFALITARLDTNAPEYIDVIIDGVKKTILLQYNFITGTHIADLEILLKGTEQIAVDYLGNNINMICQSNFFEVKADQAIEIAVEQLGEDISSLREGDKLFAECYLRVLDKVVGGFDKTFWLFSICSVSGEMNNVIISTADGKILASSQQYVV